MAPAAAAARTTASRSLGRIGDAGNHRRATHAYAQSRLGQRAHCIKAQVGTRRAGLENPREFDVEVVTVMWTDSWFIRATCAQQVQVADDQIRFGDNAELEAAMAGELFQNSTSDFVAAFGGLVGIGGRAERDGFARLDPAQFAAQQVRRRAA